MKLDKEYWNLQYEQNKYGWDIGYPSTPIKNYIDQLTDKSIKILIPGAGHAYEAEYLYNHGFINTFVLDYAEKAITKFKARIPDFPESQILVEDFFKHDKQYDLIIEQTFLTSLPRMMREAYSRKMHGLLKDNGKLVGLVFNHEFYNDSPPYGGTPEEYKLLFNPYFKLKIFEVSYNSIKPRQEREHFFILIKK
ncbi:MAG: methyltransferase domain-containing protein [Bacteroidetes bacterium]|nr:methyltransferase domain-containing protein [Bacteroidota bacterium]